MEAAVQLSENSPWSRECGHHKGGHSYGALTSSFCDGPGNLWSPETLLVGAVADCFRLTFRSIAKVGTLRWISLTCEGDGTVDRANGTMSFTAVQLRARLTIPDTTDMQDAERLLDKATKACLISNSLKFTPTFKVDVAIGLAA